VSLGGRGGSVRQGLDGLFEPEGDDACEQRRPFGPRHQQSNSTVPGAEMASHGFTLATVRSAQRDS